MFLNFAMLHFLNPHLRTFRGTEAFAFMGSALQQMTAAAIPLSLAQVCRCVCVFVMQENSSYRCQVIYLLQGDKMDITMGTDLH